VRWLTQANAVMLPMLPAMVYILRSRRAHLLSVIASGHHRRAKETNEFWFFLHTAPTNHRIDLHMLTIASWPPHLNTLLPRE
jgi:hypothetical protein